jgi:hypothetical protein
MVYLHTASLGNPMNDTWSRIYFYLFKKFNPEADSPEHETNLSQYELKELEKLKRWIYKKQVEAFQQKRTDSQL